MTEGLRILRRSGEPAQAVQVYGQRCSGTHFLIRTIERSFDDLRFTEAYGFKHWFVPHHVAIPKGVLVLVIAREVEDWVRSLYGKPWHVHPRVAALPFGAFLRSEWHAVWDDENFGIGRDHPLWGREMLHERCPATGARFANPLAMRSAKLAHWAGLVERAPDVALIRYEALRDRPLEVLNGVRRRFGLAPSAVKPIRSYKGHGEKAYRPSRYPPLAEEDRAFIRANLDTATESLYGYVLERAPAHGA